VKRRGKGAELKEKEKSVNVVGVKDRRKREPEIRGACTKARAKDGGMVIRGETKDLPRGSFCKGGGNPAQTSNLEQAGRGSEVKGNGPWTPTLFFGGADWTQKKRLTKRLVRKTRGWKGKNLGISGRDRLS